MSFTATEKVLNRNNLTGLNEKGLEGAIIGQLSFDSYQLSFFGD